MGGSHERPERAPRADAPAAPAGAGSPVQSATPPTAQTNPSAIAPTGPAAAAGPDTVSPGQGPAPRNTGAAPGTRPRLAQGREHIVATVDEIPPGSSKVVPIGRHGVGVYNVNGTFYAIANYCPHEGGPLCSGRARGRTVVDESVPGDSVMVRDNEFIYCPWHQWGFELATGTTAVKPEWSIRTYPVRVVGDDVLVTA